MQKGILPFVMLFLFLPSHAQNVVLPDVPAWNLEGGPDNNYSLDVAESTKFPLIFKLDTGFSMTLTEIKSR
jgi:hypothetical protein